MDDIDPEIAAVRARQATLMPPFDLMAMPIERGRALIDQLAISLNEPVPDIAAVEDVVIAASGLPARFYRPVEAPARQATLYIHGGGFSTCGIATHERLMRALANASGRTLLGPSYRLAPVHPFPAALDDVRAAYRQLLTQAGSVVVAGDSAGANLALALAIGERDAGGSVPAGLALLYGCYSPTARLPSRTRYAAGYGLTPERMDWYWRNYLGSDTPNSLAAPLDCDLAGLPPSFIGIAECDILADESRLLANRMAEAGVATTMVTWPGAVHGFLQMTRDVRLARRAAQEVANAIASFLDQSSNARIRTGSLP